MDALQAETPILSLLYSNPTEIANLPIEMLAENNKIQVKQEDFKKWSELTTAPGLLGIFQMPDTTSLARQFKPSLFPVSVVCDNIREPGNMGAILRCCAAAGCQEVILTKGCVDIWERKVLRAASGAHFRMPIRNKMLWNDIRPLFTKETTVYLADCVSETNLRNKKSVEDDIPLKDYADATFHRKNTVIILGGETEGLSEDARKYTSYCHGERLHIQMENNVDSLNTGVALAIILFELKRKWKVAL